MVLQCGLCALFSSAPTGPLEHTRHVPAPWVLELQGDRQACARGFGWDGTGCPSTPSWVLRLEALASCPCPEQASSPGGRVRWDPVHRNFWMPPHLWDLPWQHLCSWDEVWAPVFQDPTPWLPVYMTTPGPCLLLRVQAAGSGGVRTGWPRVDGCIMPVHVLQ